MSMVWKRHFLHAGLKILAKTVNMSKHILYECHLTTLYYSLIHPYLLYGIHLWGNTFQKHLRKLEVAQKKAIRAITGAQYNNPSSPLYKKLSITKFCDTYRMQCLLFMHDFVNKNLPGPLLQIFAYHSSVHDHDTRHSTDPKPPKITSEIMRRNYLRDGPCEWMSLESGIKSSKSKKILKRKLTHKFWSIY